VHYKDEYLKEVINRSIKRIKPCSEKGEEFRDSLLWLTLLYIAEASENKMIVIISNNIKEFASDNGSLHPKLKDEEIKKDIKKTTYIDTQNQKGGYNSISFREKTEYYRCE